MNSERERFFTTRQKRHLYVVTSGRCERCGAPLGERWDAHHKQRFSDGGRTEIGNAAALCERCHKQEHRRIGVITPHGWQKTALRLFIEHEPLSFLLEATPGAGKTIFSAFCAASLFDQDRIDFCLIVVPTTAIKGDEHAGFCGDWSKVGVEVKRELSDGVGPPADFRGGTVTYQQLPNIASTIETWADNGKRLFMVFDEIHHASDNVWGAAVERVARRATKVLAMTGTPFRGDGRSIAFVTYENGVARPDYQYRYTEAVRDRVCRNVEFIIDDGLARFARDAEKQEIRLSEATEFDVPDVARTIFRQDSEWLRIVVEKAEAALDDFRTWDTDAGALMVARPGGDPADDRWLQQIARLVRDVTGEEPEIIFHEDPDADAKIARFRKSMKRWISAVRKISEGVDVKRLRILVIANNVGSELLFRQLIGRVLRVDNAKRPGHAIVFIPKMGDMPEWAARIREEAEAGLRQRGTEPGGGTGSGPDTASSFVALGSTHEDGGAISDFGDVYDADEINAAEHWKRGDPQLLDIPVTKLAYIRRKAGLQPEAPQPATEPLDIQKSRLRASLSKKVRSLTYKRVGDDRERYSEEIKRLYLTMRRFCGAKDIEDLVANYSIDVMRQVEQWLDGLAASGKDDDAAA